MPMPICCSIRAISIPRGQVLRFDLPPIEPEARAGPDWFNAWFNRVLQPGNLPVYKEAAGRRRLDLSGSHECADRRARRRGARHRKGRADRLGRRAGPAFPRRARRAAAVDAGRRYRQDRPCRAAGDHARLRRRGAGQRHPVAAALEHDRQSAAAPVGGRHPRAPRRRQGA